MNNKEKYTEAKDKAFELISIQIDHNIQKRIGIVLKGIYSLDGVDLFIVADVGGSYFILQRLIDECNEHELFWDKLI